MRLGERNPFTLKVLDLKKDGRKRKEKEKNISCDVESVLEDAAGGVLKKGYHNRSRLLLTSPSIWSYALCRCCKCQAWLSSMCWNG